MTVDQELFNKIADAIEAQPQFYNQGSWAMIRDNRFDEEEDARALAEQLGFECGTAYCICGWAVQFSATPEQLRQANRTAIEERGAVWKARAGDYRVDPNGFFSELCELVTGSDDEMEAGAKLLGIDEDDAEYLFHGGWGPQTSLSVPEALRKIGGGANVRDV